MKKSLIQCHKQNGQHILLLLTVRCSRLLSDHVPYRDGSKDLPLPLLVNKPRVLGAGLREGIKQLDSFATRAFLFDVLRIQVLGNSGGEGEGIL